MTAAPTTLPGVSHRFVDAAGLRMHVVEAGSPSADPVLLLHGWPQHWYMWRHQIPALAERHRVICADLRGFGWSDAPPGDYAKEAMATDVLNLLDALQLERVKLAGHDWGGWVGFLVCLRAPERIERLLVLNMATPFNRASPRVLAAMWRFWYQVVIGTPVLGAWILRNRPGLVERIIRGSAQRPDVWSDADLARYTERLRVPERAAASVRLYRTFLTRELPAVAAGRYMSARLRVPTLLLFGVDDFAISPSLVSGYEERADDMRVEFVPDIGHFIAEERPELVNGKALEFFATD